MVLKDIHKIRKDNFEFSERQIIYSFIDKHIPSSSSSSVAELTDILDKNEKASVKNLITNRFKEDKTSIFESSKNF